MRGHHSGAHACLDTGTGRGTLPTRRWFTFAILIRVCLVIALSRCLYLTAKQGISSWYLRQDSPAALERAIQWDAANPQNFDDFGNLIHLFGDAGSPDRIVQAYEAATRLSPQNAQYWADLGSAYDWSGRRDEALAAFHRAQQLFPNSPEINWRVANFLIRTGKTTEGLECLRKVLWGESIPRRDVFALATRATHDNNEILDRVVPGRRAVLTDYLNFQIAKGDLSAAEQVWQRLLALNIPFAIQEAFPYLDALIQHRKLAEVEQTRSLLASRFPSETHSVPRDRSLVTNGSFEYDILNGAFDWRVAPVQGAHVSLDSENRFDGSRSLRIDFDGTENPYYCHVFQYVLVQPETHYRFSGYMRVEGITTDSGPLFEIYDAYDMQGFLVSTQALVGTSEWSLRQVDFITKPNTRLLVVRVGRRPSQKLENQIAGTVWVDKVMLETENGQKPRKNKPVYPSS